MRRNKTPVVIVRKAKKINPVTHGLAFMLTGGTSGIYTAAKAASNAGYNARTRQMQAEAEGTAPVRRTRSQPIPSDQQAEYRAEHVPSSKEYKARHGS